MKIIPETPAYDALNAAGNPLLLDAEIRLTGLPTGGASAFSFADAPPVVWAGGMLACTFEALEEFFNLIAEPYGATDGNIRLTTLNGSREQVIGWDCDRGYVSGSLTGREAVAAVAARLLAAPDAGEGINS